MKVVVCVIIAVIMSESSFSMVGSLESETRGSRSSSPGTITDLPMKTVSHVMPLLRQNHMQPKKLSLAIKPKRSSTVVLPKQYLSWRSLPSMLNISYEQLKEKLPTFKRNNVTIWGPIDLSISIMRIVKQGSTFEFRTTMGNVYDPAALVTFLASYAGMSLTLFEGIGDSLNTTGIELDVARFINRFLSSRHLSRALTFKSLLPVYSAEIYSHQSTEQWVNVLSVGNRSDLLSALLVDNTTTKYVIENNPDPVCKFLLNIGDAFARNQANDLKDKLQERSIVLALMRYTVDVSELISLFSQDSMVALMRFMSRKPDASEVLGNFLAYPEGQIFLQKLTPLVSKFNYTMSKT